MKQAINTMCSWLQGDFKPLWIACLIMLIADAIDVLVSWINSCYMPIWEEANPLARDPFNHKLLLNAAITLHGEFYILLFIPAGYLTYKWLRCYFNRKQSAFILSFYPWYSFFHAMKDGVLSNIALGIFYHGWYKHLMPLK
jgi:hypothetical protein